VKKVLRLANKENIFYEHPESSKKNNSELCEYAVIAVIFLCAQLGRYFSNGG
jgi:hypothetical protein